MAQFRPVRITITAVDKLTATLRRIENRTEGFKSRLASVGRVAAKITAGLLAIGGAAVYAGSRLISGFVDKASSLVDAADRIGITAERFQELALVAEQFGVEQGALELAMRKFVKEGGRAEDFATSFADGIAQIEDESLRAKVLVKALGRNGQALGPMFNDGARGIAAMVEEFRRMNAVQSEDTLRRADSLGDKWSRIQAAIAGVTGTAFTAFLPDLERAAAAMEKWLGDAANQAEVRKTFETIAETFRQMAAAAPTVNTMLTAFNKTIAAWNALGNPFTIGGVAAGAGVLIHDRSPFAKAPATARLPQQALEGRIVVEVRDRGGVVKEVRTIANSPNLFMALEEKFGPAMAR